MQSPGPSSVPRWPSASSSSGARAVEHVHAQLLVRVQEDGAVERRVRRHRRDQQPAVAGETIGPPAANE